jgi:hypothetical protein
MRKYGLSSFTIEMIEETDIPEEREVFWIEQKGSFKHGYNATMGGDGKRYLDYDLIVATYQELQNVAETARRIGVDVHTVKKILEARQIKILPSYEVNQRVTGNVVN